jgi:N-acetylmuramoyl-L-alanine amidase
MDPDNGLMIDKSHPSPNYNQRISCLILHYTACDLETSLKVLADSNAKNRVSAHYLVPESAIDEKRKVYQLVEDSKRAWHAGISSWQDRENLNDTSIGIEIVNLGYKDDDGKRKYYPFEDYQIESVIQLAKRIVKDYSIQPTGVTGHADIAPGRKFDPGPLFPWKKLYDQGIGAWPDKSDVEAIEKQISIDPGFDYKWIQDNLRVYGYKIETTGELDKQTKGVIIAFQMHFQPDNYLGIPNIETISILEALIKKYYPHSQRPYPHRIELEAEPAIEKQSVSSSPRTVSYFS